MDMTAKRQRGLVAFLSDVSNIPGPSIATGSPPTKRCCANKACSKITAQIKQYSPRGRHAPIPPPSPPPPPVEPVSRPRRSVVDYERTTENTTKHLTSLLKNRPEVQSEGMTCIHIWHDMHIERNTSFTIQKAIALRIFSVCVFNGSGIIEACEQASSVTSFSAEVIRRWAVEVFRDYFSTLSTIEEVTDKSLEKELYQAEAGTPNTHP